MKLDLKKHLKDSLSKLKASLIPGLGSTRDEERRLRSLEKAYLLAEPCNQGMVDREKFAEKLGSDRDANVVTYFLVLMRLGLTPPPEVLLALEKAFITYHDAGGRLDLEEVFYGPRKRAAGGYAQRLRRARWFRRMQSWIDDNTMSGEKGKERSVGEFLDACGMPGDPASELRGLRRYNTEEQQFKAKQAADN